MAVIFIAVSLQRLLPRSVRFRSWTARRSSFFARQNELVTIWLAKWGGWIVRFSNTWPQIPCRWSVKDDKDRWKSHFDGLVMFVESWELRFLGQYWNNTGIWVATDLSRTDGFPALCIHGEKRQEELCQLEFCWAIAISGWWFQLFFVRPYVGRFSHLTLAIQYFSDGLVQLPSRFWKSILLEGCWNFLQFLFSPGERVGHERV